MNSIIVRIEKLVGKFVTKIIIGADIITLTRINIRHYINQNGKSGIPLTLHDTTNNTVVHEIGTQRKIVQSLFYSSHSCIIFMNSLSVLFSFC